MSTFFSSSRKASSGAAGITPLKARTAPPSGSSSSSTIRAVIPEDAPAENRNLVLPTGKLPEVASRDERNSFYAFAEFDVAKDCQICADSLENPESPELQGDEIVKLMCNHRFHKKCIEDFRAFGVNSVCNICRKKLPPSPEKQFDDG